jgi:hypothetical protein
MQMQLTESLTRADTLEAQIQESKSRETHMRSANKVRRLLAGSRRRQ